MSEEIDQVLAREARSHASSVNALIAGILQRFVEWDRFAEKTQRISLEHSQLRTLFDSAGFEKLTRLSEEGAARFLDLAGFISGSTDLSSLLRILELNGRYTGLWKMEQWVGKESLRISFYHELGEITRCF